MIQLSFSDKIVTYDTFVNDIAARVATMMKQQQSMPEYISQREAFRLFGQGNVRRWRRQGKIEPCVRPGKIEYCTSRLVELKNTKQDYFD